MPGMARSPDFLRLHHNVEKRVSNLETGVHPTGSGNYYDTYELTDVALTNPKFELPVNEGIAWQRRVGIVQLIGKVALDGDLSTMNATEVLLTLPAPARPKMNLYVQGQLDFAPWTFVFEVHTDGQVILHKPAGSGSATFHFGGASWTAN